ncbi:hypothetical protein [Hwanghaeella sp. LZ110]|uniref:hypothetical protein n=1 Tax=Hwanghaeella sp. LZ110 TaxID=3402810 RepID=UPI003B680EC0
MGNPTANYSFEGMSDAEKAALAVDPVTGFKIVASAKRGGVEWLSFEDGTEAVRDQDGNAAVWPE